jgi:hypothetical protein
MARSSLDVVVPVFLEGAGAELEAGKLQVPQTAALDLVGASQKEALLVYEGREAKQAVCFVPGDEVGDVKERTLEDVCYRCSISSVDFDGGDCSCGQISLIVIHLVGAYVSPDLFR